MSNRFSPFIESIQVKFICDNCNSDVLSDEITVPAPNFSAKISSDSYNYSYDYTVCNNCKKDFTIFVHTSFTDGFAEIENIISKDIDVIEKANEYLNYILSSSNFILIFNQEVLNLQNLLNTTLADKNSEKTLLKLVYFGAITLLENYLSSKLINEIINNPYNFKNFVQNFQKFRNSNEYTLTLDKIFEKLNNLENIVKKVLGEILFHNLPQVKEIYQSTFNIVVPDIRELMKFINTRYNIIHKNGKDKDGNEIEITKESINNVIDKVQAFVNELDKIIEDKKDKKDF